MANIILRIILLGISANLDNLGVGLAYGIRRIRVPPLSNLIIAAIAFVFSCVSTVAGSAIGAVLPPSVANTAGALVLIGVGVWVMLAQDRGMSPAEAKEPSLKPPSVVSVLREPERADYDRSTVISLQESLLLGVALSINVLANGVTAGLWRLWVLPTAFAAAAFSYIAIWLGARVGSRYGAAWLGRKATIAAGYLLLLLGLHQLLAG